MNQTNETRFLRDRLPWLVAAVAVVAMAVTMYVSRDGAGKSGSDDEAVEQLTARLEALEASQGGARSPGVGGSSFGPGRGAANGAPGMLGLDERVPKTAEQMEADRQKELRELEAQFARDVADPVSGGQAENILQKTVTSDTMASTGLKPNDVDIDCKKNSCRIVGSFAKMGDAQDWGLFYITAAGGNVLSQTQMVFLPQTDGSTQVRIYSRRAKG